VGVVAHHHAALHHEVNGTQRVNVLERIGIESVDIGELTRT
jgi:hypothetical protein